MFNCKQTGFSAAVLLTAFAGLAHADVKMPAIFGDHMVLQQDRALPVWGTADPGEKVTVTVGTESGTATADTDGKWMVKLAPLAEVVKPVTMTVTGKNTLTFSDVLVGDVWICSGQSNMEFALAAAHNAKDVTPAATDPQFRLFHVTHKTALDPQTDVTGKWTVSAPGTVGGFSAVGYFFGRELRSTLNRPIGMIESNWGGTAAQAWTPLSGLQKDPAFQAYITRYNTAQAAFPAASAAYAALLAKFQADDAVWQKDVGVTYTPLLTAWQKDSAAAVAANQPPPPKPVPSQPEPKPPADPAGGPGTPSALYNGMIAPLIPYGIKGIIWYQGESNAGDAASAILYRTLFGRMITEWRGNWAQGDFPFLFVDLACFGKNGPNDSWPFLRESQLKTLALPATGMASAVDIGNPKGIHPADKLDVGLRLALAAKHVAYGQDVVYSGPTFDSMKMEDGAIRVNFTQTGGGLVIGTAPWHPADVTPPSTDTLTGFTIAGPDRNWVPAQAKIEGNSVVISSPQVPQPAAVRYAWANAPVANLYNKEGLPAWPFRTDDWPAPMPPAHPLPPAKATTPAPAPTQSPATSPAAK